MRGLSPVAASGGHSSLRCAGLSLSQPLLLRSTGSRCAGSSIVAHGPSCSAACGIFPVQGSNPCPLHWQADSQPLHHQGSPQVIPLKKKKKKEQMAQDLKKKSVCICVSTRVHTRGRQRKVLPLELFPGDTDPWMRFSIHSELMAPRCSSQGRGAQDDGEKGTMKKQWKIRVK